MKKIHLCDADSCDRYGPFGFSIGGRGPIKWYCAAHKNQGVIDHPSPEEGMQNDNITPAAPMFDLSA